MVCFKKFRNIYKICSKKTVLFITSRRLYGSNIFENGLETSKKIMIDICNSEIGAVQWPAFASHVVM